MEYKEVEAKSILTKSKLPGTDFVINIYTGCQFGCSYCYATFMKKFTSHLEDEWGEFVDVKINAVNLLDKELPKVPKNSSILFGSVCDSYQPAECKYRLTRGCLKILQKTKIPVEISVLTKSPLVLRDIDLLEDLKRNLKIEIGITIPSVDDKFSNNYDGVAPSISSRFKTLERLNSVGIETYAFCGPIIPGVNDSDFALCELFDKIKNVGTNKIWVEVLNKSKYVIDRMAEKNASVPDRGLNKNAFNIIKKSGLLLIGDEIILH